MNIYLAKQNVPSTPSLREMQNKIYTILLISLKQASISPQNKIKASNHWYQSDTMG